MVVDEARFGELMHNFAIPAAIEAGLEVMKYYRGKLAVGYKSDQSPVTDADIAASRIIENLLSETGLPVLSEEKAMTGFEERRQWETYWLIDPIDGTKEFIRGGSDFTINIALIHQTVPEIGVIFAPAMSEIWFGYSSNHAFKACLLEDKTLVHIKKLPTQNDAPGIRIVASKSHMNARTEEFVKRISTQFGSAECLHIGSSLKFCLIAEGSANIYARLGAINEWDIAAGHAIVRAAGGHVVNMNTRDELVYNTEEMKTDDFAASCHDAVLVQILDACSIQ